MIIINYMRKLLARFKGVKGFTLIELLVVIGILGILAAALIATIDPFEQLKKAQDANVKNLAVEFVNANIRYYTTHNRLPWATGGSATCIGSGFPSGELLDTSRMVGCTTDLVNDGELKTAFSSSANLDGVAVTSTSSNNEVIACFAPQSKAQRSDVNTKYTITGTPIANPSATCIGQGSGTTVCYWCIQ